VENGGPYCHTYYNLDVSAAAGVIAAGLEAFWSLF